MPLKQIERYDLRKSFFGVLRVHYACPNPACGELLYSPATDTGLRDYCPDCGCQFRTPGQTEVESCRSSKIKPTTESGIKEDSSDISDRQQLDRSHQDTMPDEDVGYPKPGCRRQVKAHNPVRSNPFAILALSGNANGTDICNRSQMATMRAKFSGEETDGLPIAKIEQAGEKLSDPVKRFTHALFWVTLTDEELGLWRDDPTLASMSSHTCGRLADSYSAIANSESVDTRLHNLAVLYLADAITMDLELLQSDVPALNNESQAIWRMALEHWALTVESDAFRKRMQDRAQAMDDPRLHRDYVRSALAQLPRKVLKTCCELSTAHLLQGDASGALGYVDLMRSSPFRDEVNNACLGDIYKPLTDRIEHIIAELDAEMELIVYWFSLTLSFDKLELAT